MRIDIAVEKENAHFRFDDPTINFPFIFLFMDRTSNTLVEVSLDLDTFNHLVSEMDEKLNIEKLLKKLK